jgi:hypothetical protein
MNLGEIFSKVETLMSEAYINKTLDKQTVNLKKFLLENKNLSKIYYLYNELNKKQGFDVQTADDFINESCQQIKDLEKSLKVSDIKKWTKNVVCENKYQTIDSLVDSNPLTVKEKIDSKKIVKENLTQKEIVKESVKIPFSTMEKIKENVLKNYLTKLDENTQKELMKILESTDETLNEEFKKLKVGTVEKLNLIYVNESQDDVKISIKETMNKINEESYSKYNYVKLKNLNEEI